MSHSATTRPFPRFPLVGAGILVAGTILAALSVRTTGVGAFHAPDAAPVMARDVTFLDQPDGSIVVHDGTGQRLVYTVPPASNGFIRGTLRGLARERHRAGDGAQTPFRLTSWADGRLTLDDLATGRRIELESFGETNAGAFAAILAAAARP
jgi:putative photosynthetic complex assembly protein